MYTPYEGGSGRGPKPKKVSQRYTPVNQGRTVNDSGARSRYETPPTRPPREGIAVGEPDPTRGRRGKVSAGEMRRVRRQLKRQRVSTPSNEFRRIAPNQSAKKRIAQDQAKRYRPSAQERHQNFIEHMARAKRLGHEDVYEQLQARRDKYQRRMKHQGEKVGSPKSKVSKERQQSMLRRAMRQGRIAKRREGK